MTAASPLFFIAAAADRLCAAAPDRASDDVAGATPAALALDGLAAGHRQYSPPRRADAKRHVVARPRPGVARHRGRDRRQSAPRIGRRAAGEGAVVLLPRYSGGRCGPLRCLRARPGARLDARARADAARPYRRGKRRAGGGTQTGGRLALGAARRPRHYLRRRSSCRLASRRRPVVGRRLFRPAAGVAREPDGAKLQSQDRRYRYRERARPQHHRTDRQSSRRRLGKPRHQFRSGVFARHFRGRAA